MKSLEFSFFSQFTVFLRIPINGHLNQVYTKERKPKTGNRTGPVPKSVETTNKEA